jgi:hypothetical protein
MSGRIWLPPFAAIAFFFGTAAAFAQTVGAEESINPDGVAARHLTLTAAQRSALYTAVMQQKVRISINSIPVAIGASVPSTLALRDLPDDAVAEQPWADLLKYAMVEDDVVVVDPIAMRVVDIIRGSARP